MQFKFTGNVPEDFPSLVVGHTVQPGEVLELAHDPKHPRLERVGEKARPKPRAKARRAVKSAPEPPVKALPVALAPSYGGGQPRSVFVPAPAPEAIPVPKESD
jgi:hypothetical protein